MCTAATYCNGDFYFGRNLDYEFSYGEHVTITPRNYPIRLHDGALDRHYAMIGMAHIQDDYPLYYDAVNEKGLCIAGLNFVGNAVYPPVTQGVASVAQYALIPWLLGTCANVAEARSALARVVIDGTPFAPELPCAQLHWLVADRSRGMGALGLPGDLSSPSRFVRAAFVRANASAAQTEDASVSQFFHILTSVEQQRGCCELDDGQYEITLYSSCCNADRGIYYYTTYDNRQITGVKLHAADLDSAQLTAYPLADTQQIRWEN